MKKKSLALAGVLAVGIALAVAAPANAASAVLYVPDDFEASLSDTRATGHYELVGSGLRVYTDGATSTDKVAEYIGTSTRLATVGEPTLEFTNTSLGGTPGYQLLVDFDGDGTTDGILVGEPGSYGNDWWLNNAAASFVKAAAPSTTGGSGSAYHGTLDQWREVFPDANVTAFGFSLGSGVKGDGVLNAINFAGTRYTFAMQTVLDGREACKKGGWETSSAPVFTNQGDCVSYFARN
ncbi:hypothetical protein ABIB15_003032 [Marisediminicola sp. UYEF4]|uniref:hypothetical protein n=1 Tax=Marisediminicola sp. UYEF4 TaxID=1756384 RepID=UPI00339351F5